MAVGKPIQYRYRFRNNDGNETAATWKAADNMPVFVPKSTIFRLRFTITNSGNAIASWFPTLYYDYNNSGTYYPITSASGYIRLATGNGANVSCTDQLSAPAAWEAIGQYYNNSPPGSSYALGLTKYQNWEWGLIIDDSATNGYQALFKMYNATAVFGTPDGTHYPQIAGLTIGDGTAISNQLANVI